MTNGSGRGERGVGRRSVLVAAAAAVGLSGAGVVAGSGRVRHLLGLTPDPYIPDAPLGRVRLEQVSSTARGRPVGLFTAVPHGHGRGTGLPVCLVLHGSSATTADYRAFGLGRFLTAAVRAGAPPFVLAGVDGGRLWWEPGHAPGDDPQRMLVEELPGWLGDRGYDASRLAAWGWSMGGYGALRLAQEHRRFLRAAAAFSPAIEVGGPVFDDADALAGTPLGLWCGRDDPLVDAVRQLVRALPEPPAILRYGEGGHTRLYWNRHIVDAFGFLGRRLVAA